MKIPHDVRKDIPLTKSVAYFDNAATSLTPLPVVEAMTAYYLEYRGNVHRGVHRLSQRASAAYDEARRKVAEFVHASPEEIIFVKNTTEALNCVALGLQLQRGEKVVTTALEHHSNFLPFVQLKKKGITCEVIEATHEGLCEEQFTKIEGAALVTCSYVSNALGTILPVEEIGDRAHETGALFCVDAAQAVGHMPVDVRQVSCDFLAFSGHKGCMGPTGVGVLYIKKEVADIVDPLFLGGGMIKDVVPTGYTVADPPEKYEAGTPNIGGVIGLGAALDYVTAIGVDCIHQYEAALTEYTLDALSARDTITWYGPPTPRSGVISFNVTGLHCHDVASILDSHDIMVRSGHHCALPIMKKLGIEGTVRASYHCYNTEEEVDRMISVLNEISSLV
jgi:cysteine desulfurase/selenocysteine lyase